MTSTAPPPPPPAPSSDFRSDTVTRPTDAMRRSMAEAEVGDDVFGDDPTVRGLEEEAAALFGKEAGLYCVSGTMANLLAVLVHGRPGEEALVEARSHTFRFEQGGAARFGGVQLRPILGDEAGRIQADEVEREIMGGPGAPLGERLHSARTALCILENTHNFAGGRVQPLGLVEDTAARCRARGVKVHMDGARIMNAVVASGVAPARWAAACDTLMCGLSKGLCAPVGSVLVGSAEDMLRARIARKALGGGLRQVGVIAAPARLALSSMAERLADDHANAKALAEGLAGIPGILLDPSVVETNIVFARLAGGAPAHRALAAALTRRGIGCAAVGEHGVRFVTHRDVGPDDVTRALVAARAAMAAGEAHG